MFSATWCWYFNSWSQSRLWILTRRRISSNDSRSGLEAAVRWKGPDATVSIWNSGWRTLDMVAWVLVLGDCQTNVSTNVFLSSSWFLSFHSPVTLDAITCGDNVWVAMLWYVLITSDRKVPHLQVDILDYLQDSAVIFNRSWHGLILKLPWSFLSLSMLLCYTEVVDTSVTRRSNEVRTDKWVGHAWK